MRRRLPEFLLVLLVLATWSLSLRNGFALDDLIHIRDSYRLTLPDGGWSLLSEPVFPGNLYRPLTFLSYYLQMQISGGSPLFFHLINVLLQLAVALMIFRLFRPALKEGGALLAAALYAVHPLNVEVVANISGRAELLATFFVLAALSALPLQTRMRPARFMLVMVLSFCAAASKESGAVVPLLVLLWGFFHSPERSSRWNLAGFAASATGAVFYLLLRFFVLGGQFYSASVINPADNPLVSLSVFHRTIESLALLGVYLGKLFFPWPLSADYSFAVLHFSEPSLLSTIAAALVVVIFLLSLGLAVRQCFRGLCLLWFFLAFVLTSNVFFPIGTVFAERLACLPGIGIMALAAYAMNRIQVSVIRTAFTAALIGSLALYSFSHSSVWFDTAAVADYQELVSPESFRTQLLCAARDKNRRNFESALKHVAESRKILPRNDDAWYLEGAIRIEQGLYPLAEHAFQQALEANAAHLPTLALSARLMLNQNRLPEVTVLTSELLKYAPQSPEARVIQLAVSLKRQEWQRAEELLAELEKMNYQSDDLAALSEYLKRHQIPPSR